MEMKYDKKIGQIFKILDCLMEEDDNKDKKFLVELCPIQVNIMF